MNIGDIDGLEINLVQTLAAKCLLEHVYVTRSLKFNEVLNFAKRANPTKLLFFMEIEIRHAPTPIYIYIHGIVFIVTISIFISLLLYCDYLHLLDKCIATISISFFLTVDFGEIES